MRATIEYIGMILMVSLYCANAVGQPSVAENPYSCCEYKEVVTENTDLGNLLSVKPSALRVGGAGVYLVSERKDESQPTLHVSGGMYKFDWDLNLEWHSTITPGGSGTSKRFVDILERSDGGVVAMGNSGNQNVHRAFVDGYSASGAIEHNVVSNPTSFERNITAAVRHPQPALPGYPYYVLQGLPSYHSLLQLDEVGNYHPVSGRLDLYSGEVVKGMVPTAGGDIIMFTNHEKESYVFKYYNETSSGSNRSLIAWQFDDLEIVEMLDSGKGYYVAIANYRDKGVKKISVLFIREDLRVYEVVEIFREHNACPDNTAWDMDLTDNKIVFTADYCGALYVWQLDLLSYPFSDGINWFNHVKGGEVSNANTPIGGVLAVDRTSNSLYVAFGKQIQFDTDQGVRLHVQRFGPDFDAGTEDDCFSSDGFFRTYGTTIRPKDRKVLVTYEDVQDYGSANSPSQVTIQSGQLVRNDCRQVTVNCNRLHIVQSGSVFQIAKNSFDCINPEDGIDVCNGETSVTVSGHGQHHFFTVPATANIIEFSTEGWSPGMYTMRVECGNGCFGIRTIRID